MESFKHHGQSFRARLAGMVIALLSCLVFLGSVLALFASASGELDPLLARLQGAPAASAVVVKAAARPAPS